jgi:hypothetical protein
VCNSGIHATKLGVLYLGFVFRVLDSDLCSMFYILCFRLYVHLMGSGDCHSPLANYTTQKQCQARFALPNRNYFLWGFLAGRKVQQRESSPRAGLGAKT